MNYLYLRRQNELYKNNDPSTLILSSKDMGILGQLQQDMTGQFNQARVIIVTDKTAENP